MKNNDDIENMLPQQHVETHPRKGHRDDLRQQMLAAYRHETRENLLPRPLLFRWTERAAVLAAGVVLGLGISWFFRANSTETSPQTPSPVVLVLEHAPPESRTKTTEDGFWSTERLISNWKQSHPNTKYQVRWTSPLRTPEIGELQ